PLTVNQTSFERGFKQGDATSRTMDHHGGCGAVFPWRTERGPPKGGRVALKDAMAKLYFHYSTMNAGKSTALLQASYNYRERGMATMLFIAALDDRAGRGRIGSRIGLSAEAEMFGPGDDLLARVAERHGSKPVHCVFV